MNPVTIPVEQLSRTPRAFGQSVDHARSQQTRFCDLPLPARLLLAVPRVRGVSKNAPLAERYVLDTLGRIIVAGPERAGTIEAVNLLAEVLQSPETSSQTAESADPQWLSSLENMVLCVLCKVRDGQTEMASQLVQHWLTKTSVQQFTVAASTLCQSECFKRGGPHVFTPAWSGAVTTVSVPLHRSVKTTEALSLGESVLLNALRLRIRTLTYAGISTRVVPMLRQHLALPRIESLIDAHLIEALQYCEGDVDVRCLCSQNISAQEARFIASMASFCTGDSEKVVNQLSGWLPAASVERLMGNLTEFQAIVQGIGALVPQRSWDFNALEEENEASANCIHMNEPAMIH